MLKILTVATKELLLLKRDRAGLLVLFIMPAILVVVITLVQENVMQLSGQHTTQVLLLDLDKGYIGSKLQQILASSNLEVIVRNDRQYSIADIKAAVTGGDYQVGVVIPEQSSARLQRETTLLFQRGRQQENEQPATATSVQLYFDPAILVGLRSGITAQLQMVMQIISMENKLKNLDRLLRESMDDLGIAPEFSSLPETGLPALLDHPLLTLEESSTTSSLKEVAAYNPVQQNVPAWALFGMFFTAIPIAGAILQERKSGIWIRLTSLPVSPLVLFTGKVLAYMGICLCQFLLIFLIGTHLFPFIGLPAFIISGNFTAVLLTVLLSSLAACGVGVLLGTACSTYEQASTIGATTVVAAAAIGGIMVPVYAMPQLMQRLSIISPLHWGLTSFHDLLVRGYTLSAVMDDLGRLLLFFIATVLFSWKLAQIRL